MVSCVLLSVRPSPVPATSILLFLLPFAEALYLFGILENGFYCKISQDLWYGNGFYIADTWRIKLSCSCQSFGGKTFRWSNFLELKLPLNGVSVRGTKLHDRELAMSVFGDKMEQCAFPSDLTSRMMGVGN